MILKPGTGRRQQMVYNPSSLDNVHSLIRLMIGKRDYNFPTVEFKTECKYPLVRPLFKEEGT